jgi:hypothetical protein
MPESGIIGSEGEVLLSLGVKVEVVAGAGSGASRIGMPKTNAEGRQQL